MNRGYEPEAALTAEVERLRAQWAERENTVAVIARIKSVREGELQAEVERLRSENAALLKKRVDNPTVFDLAVNQDECVSVDMALHRANVAHKAGWTLANQAEVVLAAEVERLRAESATLKTANAQFVAEMHKSAVESAKLEAENAELREDAKLNWSAVKAQRDRAEAENATLKARLDWFEKRECEHDRLFRDGCSIAYIHAHMKQWMDANPKPSEGT